MSCRNCPSTQIRVRLFSPGSIGTPPESLQKLRKNNPSTPARPSKSASMATGVPATSLRNASQWLVPEKPSSLPWLGAPTRSSGS
jgi:hypothetical protein